MQVQVNESEDTEWNDILRKHGIIPEKPKDLEPEIQEALIEAQQRLHENRLEDKDLDELDALEDDEDEEFLNRYREKRMAEIRALDRKAVYGQVYPIQKVDYARDVTDESKRAFVLLFLSSSSGGTNVESRVLGELWPVMARRWGDVKFCEIRANMCIEGYPEKNCPTILVYKDGEIRRQIVTLAELRGPKTSMADLDRLLVQVGAVKEGDSRLRGDDADHGNDDGRDVRRGLQSGARRKDEDEDEADDDGEWD